MLRKLESLEIKDGKIILKVRVRPSGSGAPAGKKAIPVEVVPPKTEPSPNGVSQPKGAPSRLPPRLHPRRIDAGLRRLMMYDPALIRLPRIRLISSGSSKIQ